MVQKQQQQQREKVVLIVLDGWGIAAPSESNAISLAKTPSFDLIKSKFGYAEICASGPCVGLKKGQMGNSEVGHLTIGAGQAIFQDLMRVDHEIESGKLGKNTHLVSALRRAKESGATVHFLGLLSDGGVHSHIDHLFGLLRISKNFDVKNVIVHAILDGRDTPPKSGMGFVASLESFLDSLGVGKIATVSGRYYAMDRDNRWERTKLAFDSIVYGDGPRFEDAVESVRHSYERENVSDEFVIPRVIGNYNGIKAKDIVFFFNFRPDRARQMTKALVLGKREFGSLFDRRESKRPSIDMVSMTVYDAELKGVASLLEREHVSDTLSHVLAENGIKQLRIAETEKYAHVTYFFNGLSEKPEELEERILVPSLRIGTYDKSPEMSAAHICEKAIESIKSKEYGFILINFANADMVGHSGEVEATVKGVEKVDECLGKIYNLWKEMGQELTIFITADHGNAEKMQDEKTGQPHTAHTSNLVPLTIVSKLWRIDEIPDYKIGLVDIAPSILKILGLPKPRAMSGQPVVRQVN